MKTRNKRGQYTQDLRLYKWFVVTTGIGFALIISFMGINQVLSHLQRVITVNNTYAEELPKTIQDKIKYAEKEYGLKSDSLGRVLRCESTLRENVYGDSGLAYGIAQFHRSTFELFKKKSGLVDLDYYSTNDQIKLAAWAFSQKLQFHWTCANDKTNK